MFTGSLGHLNLQLEISSNPKPGTQVSTCKRHAWSIAGMLSWRPGSIARFRAVPSTFQVVLQLKTRAVLLLANFVPASFILMAMSSVAGSAPMPAGLTRC